MQCLYMYDFLQKKLKKDSKKSDTFLNTKRVMGIETKIRRLYMSISALANPDLIVQKHQSESGESASNAAAQEATRNQNVEYLQLLLIQLQNQNPLEPTDTNELTNQLLVQSQLEQQIQTNEKLDDLLAQNEASVGLTSISYIGQKVEILDNEAPVQSGIAEWSYVVDGLPDQINLTVTDGAGNILYQEEGKETLGPHSFTFDVANSETPVEDGTPVFLFINAVDDEGNTLDGLVSSYATIDGVDGSTGQDFLTAGNTSYLLSEVLKITN